MATPQLRTRLAADQRRYVLEIEGVARSPLEVESFTSADFALSHCPVMRVDVRAGRALNGASLHGRRAMLRVMSAFGG